jgi:anti-sigma-K factor RskA
VPPKSVRASIWNWRWMTASAAAACLVLLVVFIALRFGARQAVSGPNEPLVAQQHQPDAGPGAKFAATPRGLPRRSPA